ncbi:uncharacterized [Tachysurus ichikawai]
MEEMVEEMMEEMMEEMEKIGKAAAFFGLVVRFVFGGRRFGELRLDRKQKSPSQVWCLKPLRNPQLCSSVRDAGVKLMPIEADEQQCCEPHGSQQHLNGSERIRKTHQFHPRAAEHDWYSSGTAIPLFPVFIMFLFHRALITLHWRFFLNETSGAPREENVKTVSSGSRCHDCLPPPAFMEVLN